jgi:spore germination protein GerM
MNGFINTILVTVISVGVIISSMMQGSAFYYDFDEEGKEVLICEVMDLEEDNNIEENIKYTLTYLFDNINDRYTFIPESVKVSNILYINGSLYVEVSSDMLNYGGNMRESAIVDQLLCTVFSFDEINDFTLEIEGEREFLVEGTIINGYTRDKWNERMKLDNEN